MVTAAEQRAQVLARVIAAGDPAYAAFLRRYYRHVALEDLLERRPSDLHAAALAHHRTAATRPQGTATVRVFVPDAGADGWSCGHAVVQIVTDDMPFLVDSVNAELSRQDRALHLVMHPQLVVRRDVLGRLEEVCDTSDADAAGQGAQAESWIHLEIDRENDRATAEEVERGLRRVLSDVREAVEDWTKMRERALAIAAELAASPPPIPAVEVREGEELLRWLAEGHFTFLGFREYDLVTEDGEDLLRARSGSGLGVLRSDQPVSLSFGSLNPEVRAKAREPQLLILTKANSRATVHRPAYLDYIGVKRFGPNGDVVGERRFLGLFTSVAYNESVQRIPVLRRKVADVLAAGGFAPNSHSGKDLLEILETYPRDELFQVSAGELLPVALAVLHLQERRRLRLFLRRDDYGRFVSALVFLPRERYTTDVRLRMQTILLAELGGTTVDYTTRISESVLARLHFVVRADSGGAPTHFDTEQIEAQLVAATRSWEDDLADALHEGRDNALAEQLLNHYAAALPEAYKEDVDAGTAVTDLLELEGLRPDGGFALLLYEPVGAAPGERRFKIYRAGVAMSLSELLPVLQRLGVEVVDERPYQLHRIDGTSVWIYDFGLRYDAAVIAERPELEESFQDAFAATWRGEAENDGFNALVLAAGMTWRQAMVLRAYAKYLRQGTATFSQAYMESVLLANVPIAVLLVELFETRFDPARDEGRDQASAALVEQIEAALDEVASLDHDRILRSLLTVVRATTRTSYFQRDGKNADGAEGTDGAPEGTAKPYVAFKLDPQQVPDLPLPRPRREIWVYSPRVEGVHLRFGPVARGGLRWSDRREDFRTEVLGLVKAQMVKNAVIVPVGAKGGFVVKSAVDPTDREAWLVEGIACYTTFISGLLDLTDNLVGGEVVPPPDVVRHDGDDTYLVVAADKGTATFSDIANGIAAEYGFWLGDAFASGGSVGYDHKAMGITARGAWVSVERHFRELGHDTRTQDFTVVGVGDMSGDVFGNGMVLSDRIRLVAAFDHRHVFLDPEPDAAASAAERRRMFALPRSSWADYDASLLSEGGGVFPRTAKSIQVTAQVRAALGLDDAVTVLAPQDLMRAILRAPVDLFWNGGIGTYVKASSESNVDVGDKANDAVRVDGADLRCRVVGEGGNLGLTQRGRVEYALSGGRVNTDAIDNSAGVDTSDHEVNIKILLDRVVQEGGLTAQQRDELLAEMTEEVAGLVLRDNYGQNVALAGSLAQASSMLHVHARYLRWLERKGRLDRALEFLPSERQISERRQAGLGLTQPELAVLLAYTKIDLEDELAGSDVPEDPYLHRELFGYFPSPLREPFQAQIEQHPLRRQIITTGVVNNMVNNAGSTFVFRMAEETGAATGDIVRAHTVARVVFDLTSLWRQVEALDARVPADLQTRLRLDARKLAERAARWLLVNRRPPLDVAAQVDTFRTGVTEVTDRLPELLRGSNRRDFDAVRAALSAAGVPEELAARVASLPTAFSALDIVEVARDSGRPVAAVGEVYFLLSEELSLARLLVRVNELPRDDRWKTMARAALREELYATQAALSCDVLAAVPDAADAEARFAAWAQTNAAVLSRVRATLADISSGDAFDLATLSVAIRQLRTLLRMSSRG